MSWEVFRLDNFTHWTIVQVAICHSGSIILTWGQGWQWCHKSSLTKISFTCNSFRKTHLAMIWLSLHFVFIILWHGRLHFSDGPYAKEGMKKGLCLLLTAKISLKMGKNRRCHAFWEIPTLADCSMHYILSRKFLLHFLNKGTYYSLYDEPNLVPIFPSFTNKSKNVTVSYI